uniref:Uncharacterized protein n=1 Tax=Panthera tigris altaica TaxID=74533 RepID=A0A8C9K3J4_PANTA
MEAEVNKMKLMFQKANSDPDYIQYRPEYEIKTNHSEISESDVQTKIQIPY